MRVPVRTFLAIHHKGISESRNALYLYAHCLCVVRKKRARTRQDLTVSNSKEKKFIRPQLTICVVLYEISSYIIIWVNCGISLKCIIIVSAICVSAWLPAILLSSDGYQVNIYWPIRTYYTSPFIYLYCVRHLYSLNDILCRITKYIPLWIPHILGQARRFTN